MSSLVLRRRRSRLAILAGLASAVPTVMGCAAKSPLVTVIEADAPGYRAKAPAAADAELGRRLVGSQPETNMCFHGDTVVSQFPSWSGRTMTYESAAHADVQADFGDLVQVTGNAARSGEVQVVLKNISVSRLNDLFFNGAGACAASAVADDAYAAGKTERVLTRALRAEGIEIRKVAAAEGGLTVNTSRVDGELSAESSTVEEWSGLNLYFADYPEAVRVTRFDLLDQRMDVGATLDLQTCGFTLTAVQAAGWEGRLSCPGGSSHPMKDVLGAYHSVEVAPGVSYSARVRQGSGVAQGLVDLYRYNVVADDGG